MTSNPRHEPLFDVDPRTGDAIEVFYTDRTLETFGRCGAGWFWQSRLRGFAPDGLLLVHSLRATQRIATR
jgi:hypothetical protein